MTDNSKVIFTKDELDTVHSLLHKRNPDPLDKVVSFSAADDRWIRWEHRSAIHACLEPKILSIDFEKTRETIRIIDEVWAEVLKLREAKAKAKSKRGLWELWSHPKELRNPEWKHPSGLRVAPGTIEYLPVLVRWLRMSKVEHIESALKADGWSPGLGGWFARLSFAGIHPANGLIDRGTTVEVRTSLASLERARNPVESIPDGWYFYDNQFFGHRPSLTTILGKTANEILETPALIGALGELIADEDGGAK